MDKFLEQNPINKKKLNTELDTDTQQGEVAQAKQAQLFELHEAIDYMNDSDEQGKKLLCNQWYDGI